MFCTKCGFNAGESKFCPKCGNPLSVKKSEPVVESQPAVTPQPVVEPQQPVAPQPVVEPQQPVAPQPVVTPQPVTPQPVVTPQQPVAPQPVVEPQQPVMPQAAEPARKKKKKKWPIVLVLLIILALLGVGGYFMYPYITAMLSPKKAAVTALKDSSASFEESVNKAIDNMKFSVGSKQNSEGSLTIETLKFGNVNYMSNFKVDTIDYDVCTDMENGKFSGIIGLCNGSSDAVIKAKLYSDGSKLYVNVPELFKDSLIVDATVTNSGDSYGLYSKLASKMSSEDEQTYKNLMKKVVSYSTDCFDECVDEAEITKNKGKESVTYNGSNVDAVTYNVIVNKSVLEENIHAMIDNIYSDGEVSPYMTLLSTFGDVKKEDLRKAATEYAEEMGDVNYKIYIADGKILKVSADITQDGDTTNFVLEKTSDNSVVYNITGDDSTAAISLTNKDNGSKFDVIIKSGSEEMKMCIDAENDGDKVKFNEISMKSTIKNAEFDIKLTGENKITEISTLDLSVSDFPGAFSVNSATDSQKVTFALDVLKNFPVLKNVVSDQIYEYLYKSLMSSSTPATPDDAVAPTTPDATEAPADSTTPDATQTPAGTDATQQGTAQTPLAGAAGNTL